MKLHYTRMAVRWRSGTLEPKDARRTGIAQFRVRPEQLGFECFFQVQTSRNQVWKEIPGLTPPSSISFDSTTLTPDVNPISLDFTPFHSISPDFTRFHSGFGKDQHFGGRFMNYGLVWIVGTAGVVRMVQLQLNHCTGGLGSARKTCCSLGSFHFLTFFRK